MTNKTAYVAMNLTVGARDELRRATVDLTSDAGKRLSMSAVITAALRVAETHREELLATIAEQDTRTKAAA